MVETQQIASAMVKSKGVFDMSDYYNFFYQLIKSLGYDVNELDYSQKDVASGKDIEFHWEGVMFVDDYTKFRITIECKVRGLQDVQVVREGIKEKKNKGEVELTIKGFIMTDWQDNWEKRPFLKFLKGFYDRYLYKPTFEDYIKRLWENVYLIENEVKAFFDLPRFM